MYCANRAICFGSICGKDDREKPNCGVSKDLQKHDRLQEDHSEALSVSD